MDTPQNGDAKIKTKRLQQAYVHLLFSAELRRRWATEPAVVAKEFGLKEDEVRLIPDVSSTAFQAESYGRSSLIAREVGRRFPRVARRLCDNSAELNLANTAIFTRFLESKNFLSPGFSMPHPYGIGKGYEAVSKFYIWMRGFCRERPDENAALINDLNIDFATHLLNQSACSSTYPLALSRNGISYRDSLALEIWWILLPKYRLVKCVPTDLDSFFSSPLFFIDFISDHGDYDKAFLT
ncbi:hypothetical protein [Sphingomonas sp. ABOLH]|uniref:hypothetical protein n=1 Tax=Sphingomonas sp. ABOLH TaxID=1985881 RepID=UPI000F7DB8D4|nr:hypothetical protein [Sphingomonas sp. ABOLH]